MNKGPKLSKREITRRYEKLLHDVDTKDFYKVDLANRTNIYLCQHNHVTKTKDIDAGVTPMHIVCETCGQFATSTGYRNHGDNIKPTMEFYRPTLKELGNVKPISLVEHVLSGGLLLRKIKS